MLGDTLIIRDVKVEDNGNYTCIATSAEVAKGFTYFELYFDNTSRQFLQIMM